MRKQFTVFCQSKDFSPDQLIRLFHFGRTEAEIAELANVTPATVARWKNGVSAVPVVLVRLLIALDSQQQITGGRWDGVRADGSKLVLDTVAGYHCLFDLAEIERLSEYRRLFHLGTRQADLIERLMMERDFYRENCHKQARFGLMLNNIVG